jgi:hypothetical protein
MWAFVAQIARETRTSSTRVLAPTAADIGSGIGGPAAYSGATYGCRVSGVDPMINAVVLRN